MTTLGHVEVYRGADRAYYWRRVAGNGQITATGSEGFTRRWSAKRSARREYPGVPLVVVK